MHSIDSHGPLYSCQKCHTVFTCAMANCPVCNPVRNIPTVSICEYDPNHPHDGGYDPISKITFAGVRGSCDFCVCTSPIHTINNKRYCRACFDKRFTLIEKPVVGMGSA